MSIKIAIVDDDKIITSYVYKLLKKYIAHETEVYVANTFDEAIKVLNNNTIDLLLLDVELDGNYTCFNLLESLPSFKCYIILVTGHTEYAIRAFEFSIQDYLLKPIEEERFKHAISRFIASINSNNNKIPSRNINDRKIDRKIVLFSDGKVHFINPENIVYIKAEGNYTITYLQDGKKLLISKNLSSIEEMVSQFPIFKRVQRSYIVNVNQIKFLKRTNNGSVINLGDQLEIEINRENTHLITSILSGDIEG